MIKTQRPLYFYARLKLIVGIIFLFPHFVFPLLSATTLQVIHGNQPEIPAAMISKLQTNTHIRVTSAGYTYLLPEKNGNLVYSGLSRRFDELSIFIDLSPFIPSDINDVDGDVLANQNGIQITSLNYEWKNRHDVIIANDSSKNLGGDICNNMASYDGPYQLAIRAVVKVTTEYGIPREESTSFDKTFTVHADDGICYIRPNNLALNISRGFPPSNPNSAGSSWINRDPAYDNNVFKVQEGFFPWAKVKFPTMAFPRAKFKVMPLKALSTYTISLLNNPNNALQTVSSGEYEFSTIKPMQGTPYIIKVHNNTNNVDYFYSFSLNSSRSWFTYSLEYSASSGWSNQGRAELAYNKALTYCQNKGADLPTRAELTNSIYAESFMADNGGDYVRNNGFSRTIGGGLAAEWGKLYYYAPKNGDLKTPVGDFAYWFYWTKDVKPDNGMRYGVGVVEGNVTTVKGSDYYYMCVE